MHVGGRGGGEESVHVCVHRVNMKIQYELIIISKPLFCLSGVFKVSDYLA